MHPQISKKKKNNSLQNQVVNRATKGEANLFVYYVRITKSAIKINKHLR